MTESTSVLDRAREAIDRKAWDKAYRLLSEADEGSRLDGDALPTLGDTAYMAGHPEVAIDAWERVHAAAVRGWRGRTWGRRGRAGGRPAPVHGSPGTRARVDPAGRGPAGRPSGLFGPWSARGAPRLDVRPGRRPRWSPAARPPGHRPRDEARRSGDPGPGSQRRGPHPHLPGTPPGGTRSPGRDGRRRAVRGTRPREHRAPVLQHGLRVPGALRVRQSRGMDHRHGALVPSARDRRLPRPVPRPPGRDPPAPWGLGGRRGRGSGGVGGAPQVLTDRCGLGVGGARTDPLADGEPDGCRGGLPRCLRAGVGPESRSRPPSAHERSYLGGRGVDPRLAGASARDRLARGPSQHRPPACAPVGGTGPGRRRRRRPGGRSRGRPGPRPDRRHVRHQGAQGERGHRDGVAAPRGR